MIMAIDDPDLELLAQKFSLVSEVPRLAIVQVLEDGPATVSELQIKLTCKQSTVSRHLSTLRMTGVVSYERQGKYNVYSLTDNWLAKLVRAALKSIRGDEEDRRPER